MLGSFFRKPRMMAPQLPPSVYGTPPIAPTDDGGDFVGASMPSGGLFGAIGDPNAMPQLSTGVGKISQGFNSEGGWADKLGNIGSFLLAAGGNPAGQMLMQQRAQKQQDARQNALLQLQMDKEDRAGRRHQIQNLGNGGLAMVDPETGAVEVVRQPDAPQPGEQERLINAYASMAKDDPRRPLIERAVRGYQYTAPVMEARQAQQEALIDRRAAASSALKAQPTYSNLHPKAEGGGAGGRPITATARAKYISEAQAAIARGADPAKVKARLREMGVQ